MSAPGKSRRQGLSLAQLMEMVPDDAAAATGLAINDRADRPQETR